MASPNSEEFFKLFAQNLGVSSDYFRLQTQNPLNEEVLNALEHRDLDGFESRIFGSCFDQVRQQTGPYKIFGSVENQRVTSCVHDHVNAWHKTLRATGKL
jgi:hypothetical protein